MEPRCIVQGQTLPDRSEIAGHVLSMTIEDPMDGVSRLTSWVGAGEACGGGYGAGEYRLEF